MAVSAEIRMRLIVFARSRRTRQTQFTPEMPSRWQPTQLTDPATRQAFTEDGAWQYIADHLAQDAPIEVITLDKPQGKTGYVLKLPGANGIVIYVKLQICGDHVRGRSFHASEKPHRNMLDESVEAQSCKKIS